MHTQATIINPWLGLREHPKPTPHTVILAGSEPASWGCGLGLVAHEPIAVLRAEDFVQGYVTAGHKCERWQGTPFELFDRFVTHLFRGHVANSLHIVVAIQYDAALPLHGIAPRGEHRLPLLVAAAYTNASVVPTATSAVVTQQAYVSNSADQRKSYRCTPVQAGWSRLQYERAFGCVQEYIAAGDVYQVNLAYPLRAPACRSLALFAALQQHNPVPFGAYFHGGDFEIVCNSPERFLSRRGRTVITSPIKGTRRRGSTPAEDAALINELQQDPKERAELTMIVDLERNDLGRICEIGSVRVTAHERVETFATLHHLVSEVQGTLRSGVGWDEILSATFPSGSVTGAPKRRAMEIIAELEPGPRGFYTGVLGWLRNTDEADFALLIRTAVFHRERVEYWTGGGIVADSTASREYLETWVKAQAFIAALAEVG